jgi:2-oxoglutarate dehydrogenase E2 component (dihydrolipoamide succinyltransferase)
VPRSGPGGQVTLADLQAFFEQASREAMEKSGPAGRKLIADHGLDPAQIPATGRDGRVTKEDVLDFLAGAPAPTGASAEVPTPATAPIADRRDERVKMSRLRRTIATRLKEAQNTAAILTTFNEVDMSEVVALRKRYRDLFEEKHGVRLGFMSFFVKAVVGALQEMPHVNASIDGDYVIYHHYYDIGMAVSTEAGLKVPVIRDCEVKSFAQIEKDIADLAARARDGRLSLEEMEGGTYSITNGGVFGSMLSTPILNPPQSAILGLHKIQERAVVIDGEIQVRPMMYLAMSYDHRLIDGRESVTFLVRVKELIENPDRLMLDV